METKKQLLDTSTRVPKQPLDTSIPTTHVIVGTKEEDTNENPESKLSNTTHKHFTSKQLKSRRATKKAKQARKK